MKLLIFSFLLGLSTTVFSQNQSMNPPVNFNTGNEFGNEDLSQAQSNVNQRGTLQINTNNNQQAMHQPNQQVNPQSSNKQRSTVSRSSGGSSFSGGSSKKHKKGFFTKIGNSVEKYIYKSKGKKKFCPRHKRNKKSIIRCFG